MIQLMWNNLKIMFQAVREWFGTEPLAVIRPRLIPRDELEEHFRAWSEEQTAALSTVNHPGVLTAPVEHFGATDDWEPIAELDSVALVGVLDPAERELHEALDEIEGEFHRGMRQLMAYIQREFELSPTEELVLAGVQ